jgi:hypothetical protein
MSETKFNKEIAAMKAESKRQFDKIVAQERKAYELSLKRIKKLEQENARREGAQGSSVPREAPKNKRKRMEAEKTNSAANQKPSMLSTYK